MLQCEFPASAASPVAESHHGQAASPANQAHWYAVYTWARHEKAVTSHFEQRSIEHFLPLYASVRTWNKRVTKIQLPLFPGYVFVRTGPSDHARPLQVPGVVRYVGNRAAVRIPDDEISGLQQVLQSGKPVAPHPYLAPGSTVRIAQGALAGLRGVIERVKSNYVFIVSIEMIQRSVAVEIDGSQLAVN
jgi:transcription antitermination factor NusG